MTTIDKVRNPATATAEIHELLRERWSPRAFSGEPLTTTELRSLWEAARWAPSSMNEQPWSFVVADKYANPEAHSRIVSTLMPKNAEWAQDAPVLAVAVARLYHARNGAPNRHALYDTGQAVADLSVQATSMGLALRQMGGFSADRAAELLGLPDGHAAVVVLAIGHASERAQASTRFRKPLSEWVFEGSWNHPATFA